MAEKGKKSALGNNPLNQGVFTRTEPETRNQKPDSGIQKTVSRKQEPDSGSQEVASRKRELDSGSQKPESSFLKESEEEGREKVSLTLPPELNDWLDDLVKKGRRNHGQKIPKQIWVQAGLEILQVLPVDWYSIDSIETLREELQKLESRIQKKDSNEGD